MERKSQTERDDLEAQIPSFDNKKYIKLDFDLDYENRYSINQGLHQSLINGKEEEEINLNSEKYGKNQNNIYKVKQEMNINEQKIIVYNNYMQIPSMEYPYSNNNQSQDKDIRIPIPIPPPPATENNLLIKQPQKYEIPIRDLREIEYCTHSNKKQHLYITSPLVYVSAILLFLFLGGIVAIIVAIVLMAIASDALDSDCPCGQCCDGCCDFCDKNCYCSCLNFLDSCSREQIISSTIDVQYYSQRQNRKMEYDQYQIQQKNPGICDAIQNCLCCSCFDVLSTNKPVDGCLLNKIEVYCTNCNSKLKEEYTGLKYICPSITLGVIGFTLLGISIHFYLLLK
ncbi:hypothetical protein ABPG74_017431 [Tetrahymena malaccensis]